MGVRRELAVYIFGNAKQTMGEGKSGLVETGLTGPVATTLVCVETRDRGRPENEAGEGLGMRQGKAWE